jgi:outer membrane protein assembly factor BamA
VPWREQARMGSSTIMRGYFGGRYRDNQYLAAQAEYRKPVHRLVTLALFGSLGQVQHHIDQFNFSDTRAAGGGGIRLLINKAKQVYARIDYARSTDHTSGFYFKIGEAF